MITALPMAGRGFTTGWGAAVRAQGAANPADLLLEGFIVLLPRKHQFKICDQCVVPIKGIMPTPWGTWMQSVAASSGHRNCARDWRGAERPRRRAVGHAVRRNPRHA
jgi:hypothetical protein